MQMNGQGLMGRGVLLGLALLMVTGCGQSSEAPSADPAAEPPPQPAEAAPAEAPSPPDGHSSRIALDWAGTYSGTLPCASCPGIETEVTLNADGTFRLSRLYLDEGAAPDVRTGTFEWNEAGSAVSLDESAGEQRYQVGENVLFHLDQNGARITGDLAARYVLDKHVNDPAIEAHRWRVVELRGMALQDAVEDEGTPAPWLVLDPEEGRVSGNASCNSFSGSYAIKTGQRIRFSDRMAVTRMACPDMTLETGFLEALAAADNYTLGPDGRLSLNRARMAPLVRLVREPAAEDGS
jgi:heat shock protein HslJ